MDFRYHPSEEEYTEFVRSFYQKSAFYRRRFIWVSLVALLLVVNLLQFDKHKDDNISSLIFYFFLLFAMGWVIWRYTFLKLKIKEEDREPLLSEREIDINETHVYAKDKFVEATYQWNAFRKWEQTNNLYLLFISSNIAILIPKRVFQDREAQKAFESLLINKVKSFSTLDNPKVLDA